MTEITLATEDELSEAVGLRLVAEVGLRAETRIRRSGNGYLRSKASSFRDIARFQPVLVITDLDREQCAAAIRRAWFGARNLEQDLLFRIAVREVESWLLADHHAIAGLLRIRPETVPRDPDGLRDPKAALIRLAARAPRSIRDDIVPRPGAVASQGIGYNGRLSELVRGAWSPRDASDRSPSLSRARSRLTELAARLP